MKKTQREEDELLALLEKNEKLTLQEAMSELGVSESTARRIFVRLEKSGCAIRSYGCLHYFPKLLKNYSYSIMESVFHEEKSAIGKAVANLISNGDMIYLDSGTTLAEASYAIAGRLERGELCDISVFTNSMANLEILQNVCRVNLIGGYWRAERRDFAGYMSELSVNNLHFSKCLLGADGYSESNGFTASDFDTARLNERVLSNSDDSYVLIDSTKFSRTSVVSYSKNKAVKNIITDSIPENRAEILKNAGVNIIIAK